ncbi:uncharacterized protein LOC124272508 [Haliotis rubra]|uniref:uncharacterized protein LOC124272508 n=1 Tax=Haliotis rubra TaxID=36100 RepID=UPI001EE5A4CB|nr:uncharacterized protein LOC124272508 [Haliotis rubra]
MIGFTILVTACLQYTYSHTVFRHFTRAEELDDKVGKDWNRDLAYDTFVDCAGLCFQNKTCHSFSFYSGACYIRNTYDVHTNITYLDSPGMKTFLKKDNCVSPYKPIEDTCIWVSTSSVPNAAARLKCQMDGGDLMTVKTPNKLKLLEAFMTANGIDVSGRRAIGAYLDVDSMAWKWVDGETLSSPSLWCQPGHALVVTEPCLELFKGDMFDGRTCFTDSAGTFAYGYICEITE